MIPKYIRKQILDKSKQYNNKENRLCPFCPPQNNKNHSNLPLYIISSPTKMSVFFRPCRVCDTHVFTWETKKWPNNKSKKSRKPVSVHRFGTTYTHSNVKRDVSTLHVCTMYIKCEFSNMTLVIYNIYVLSVIWILSFEPIIIIWSIPYCVLSTKLQKNVFVYYTVSGELNVLNKQVNFRGVLSFYIAICNPLKEWQLVQKMTMTAFLSWK